MKRPKTLARKKSAAQIEAARVAAQVSARHRTGLLRAIAGLRVVMYENNRKISDRLETGDRRFDAQDLKIDALDARIDLLAQALDALPNVVKTMLGDQTVILTTLIQDRIRTVESQQQAVMRQLKEVNHVSDAIQGFGSIAILLERAEAAVAALEKREKASAA